MSLRNPFSISPFFNQLVNSSPQNPHSVCRKQLVDENSNVSALTGIIIKKKSPCPIFISENSREIQVLEIVLTHMKSNVK